MSKNRKRLLKAISQNVWAQNEKRIVRTVAPFCTLRVKRLVAEVGIDKYAREDMAMEITRELVRAGYIRFKTAFIENEYFKGREITAELSVVDLTGK